MVIGAGRAAAQIGFDSHGYSERTIHTSEFAGESVLERVKYFPIVKKVPPGRGGFAPTLWFSLAIAGGLSVGSDSTLYPHIGGTVSRDPLRHFHTCPMPPRDRKSVARAPTLRRLKWVLLAGGIGMVCVLLTLAAVFILRR